jgi:hypothetical protein
MHAPSSFSSARPLRDTLLVVGGGILCLVVGTYLMRLADVSAPKYIFLWICGGAGVLSVALVVFIGNAQIFVHKLVSYYKAVAILSLNAFILFVGLELAARSGFKIKSLVAPPPPQLIGEGNPREKVSYYASQDWAERYWYEFRLSRKQKYYPYVGWRRAPFKGQTIKIDESGIRLTPGANCGAKSFKVFAFGESSMWGTGSPDWATIPANLQRSLERTIDGPVCVVNFAESAYVLMQDIIMLLTQLRTGNVPDLVLFYNVEGGTYAAYQAGRAGVIQNLDQIAAKFEGGATAATLTDRLRSTSSYHLVEKLLDKITVPNPEQSETTPPKLITYESMGINAEKLTASIVQDYFEDYKIVTALAEKYGFKYFFLLPPHILVGNKRLTVEEQKMKREADRDTAFKTLFTAVYQTLERQSSKYPNIYAMADVFDNSDSSIWIDAGHVTPVGNQLIAARIMQIIRTQSPKK